MLCAHGWGHIPQLSFVPSPRETSVSSGGTLDPHLLGHAAIVLFGSGLYMNCHGKSFKTLILGIRR